MPKNGVLTTTSLSALGRANIGDDTVVINIALGSMGFSRIDIQVKALGPSPELFRWYRANRTIDWWPEYLARWREEKKGNREYWDAIDEIVRLLVSGRDVVLVCFCQKLNRCHRSLVERDVTHWYQIQIDRESGG